MVKIYLIFYILVLRPTAPILDVLPRQIQDPPLLVKVDGENEYFIKKLIILSIINGNANIYILQNREALLSLYRNLLIL